MKKIYLGALLLAGMLLSSCTNEDDGEVVSQVNDVKVSVSLSNFFSSYNYNDTYHGINVTDDYRTFHSEYGFYIQTRVLFYDSNSNLVDSILLYSTNPNDINQAVNLPQGSYTAVATLTFAQKSKQTDKYFSWWNLIDKQSLFTAKISADWNRFSKWSIMSYASKTFTVSSGQTTTVNLNPQPIGSLGYVFLQNFQYKNEATYGTVVDNGIRSLCVYARNVSRVFKLDPNLSGLSRYEYFDDAGSNSWYYLSDYMEPTDFDDSWTYFKTNLYDYFYILAPNPIVQFGYKVKGASGFQGYGEQSVNLTNGATYQAYWDYFQVGNPYFGIADNNHWHSYSSARAMEPGQNYSVLQEVATPSRYSLFK